ncbi:MULTISPECIES: glycosyltransferase [Streptomyces]|uniref:glycosyltransferase n=1 Tax=Streptomyces TaxID=1883 RepID=UPI0016722A10|nr:MULTISPECIES: glycosyltransferase [Streptomyces]MBD3575629.1 glycosyltransferase family 1 protein [Streptomyces sp. KD18]
MRVLILAAGSHGDVAPYTGLGARLSAAGFDVALAAPEGFAGMAERAGLEFRGLPVDWRTPARPEGAGGGGAAPGGRGQLMRRAAAFMRELGQGLVRAAEPGADALLLSTTTAPLGWHLAEALEVPALGAYLQPVAPTSAFPPVVSAGRSLGGWGNRAMGRLAVRVVDRMHAEAARNLRAELGLPAVPQGEVRRRREGSRWEVLHGFSEVLLPRPADWRPGLDVVGNWWPYCPPGTRLPGDLADFLDAGPPPVFVGFGSMAAGEGARLAEIAVRALRAAGLRGVLQAGAAGLSAGASGDDVLDIGEVPHRLLFPRTAAVVHHGGAGTTAAALEAGVPSVPVPVTADQPFWSRRVAALGAATGPIPYRDLTAESLAGELRRAVDETGYRAQAARAAGRMTAQDGAGAVVQRLERLLCR